MGIIEFADNPPLLVCRGNEDRQTQSLRRRALNQAFRAETDVTVDLTELAFADTSLMLDLAMLSNRLRRRGSTLRLRGASQQVMQLIELVGLHRLPGVQVDESETVAA